MFKKNIFLLLSGAILVLAILAIGANGFIVEAQAVPDNAALSGWAWSSNIGWIKFKSTGTEPVYGVNIVTDTSGPNAGIKRLVGGAWSSSIGWVKFNPTPGPDGYPDDTASKKDAQFSGTNIIGWARACTVFINSDCNGALKDAIYRGGWDGWLKMGGGSLLGGGVRLVGQQLTGFAWGGEVLGWVKFDQVWNGPNGCTGVCVQAPTDAILTVQILGTGEVRGTNIQCISRDQRTGCSANIGVANGASLRYIVTNNPFVRWEGDCDRIDGAQCIIDRMNNNRTVRAIFADGVVVAEQNDLIVNIEGSGVVTNINDGWSTAVTASRPYDSEEEVSLTFTPTPAVGGTYVVTGACNTSSAAPVGCNFNMEKERIINVEFITPPQYCLAVGYKQGNRMTVNYQTQNLEIAHDSTRAIVEVRDNDPNSPNPVGGVPITLNINPLYTRADNEGQPRPEVKMTSSSVPVGGSTEVWIHFPTDGQPDSGFASPYSIPGNYVFGLNQGSGVGPCNPGDPSPRINFTYIDVREREQ